MNEPMLSADQVATIAERADHYVVSCRDERVLACELAMNDVPALVAQDARWRALVGECLNTMRRLDWGDGWRNRHGVEYCVCPACGGLSWNGHAAECWLTAQIAQAQAALDGVE